MIPFPDHPGRLVTCHKPCLRGNQLHLSRCTFISGFTELYQWTCNGDISAICIHLAVLEIAMVVIFIHEIIIKMQHSKLTVLVQEKHLFAWENSASWFSYVLSWIRSICAKNILLMRREFSPILDLSMALLIRVPLSIAWVSNQIKKSKIDIVPHTICFPP